MGKKLGDVHMPRRQIVFSTVRCEDVPFYRLSFRAEQSVRSLWLHGFAVDAG